LKNLAALTVLCLCTACPPFPEGTTPQIPQTVDSPDRYVGIDRSGLPQLDRMEFNRLAALENVALYWQGPKFEPSSFMIRATVGEQSPNPYIGSAGEFSPAFDALYARLVDRRRIEAVEREINLGWPIAVITDVRSDPESDREMVRRLVRAAELIDELFAIQMGSAAVDQAPTDGPSRELLRRTHGYWCEGPETRDDPFCNASLAFPQRRSHAYPQDLRQNEALCEEIRSQPNASELMNPFAVVRKKDGKWIAVSYLDVYGDRMGAIATELEAAAAALGSDEGPMAAYLRAAALGFRTNNWDEADEAWVAMTSTNSKWYLRIAPDEVYFDPCNSKAGFHVSFARINPAALEWQDKLTPLRDDMERALAKVIGPPYEAREVSFSLPDFIDIAINAGDSRTGYGATVGQSLPNWGPVSDRGDGRTVVMTNLYSSADSRAKLKQMAALLIHPDNVSALAEGGVAEILEILLHEATHNFGPHSDAKIDGKPLQEIFGGLTSSILEELKAQTGALWFTGYLHEKGLFDEAEARASYTSSVVWALSQISHGLLSSTGRPEVYPTLSAIQISFLLDEGALTFDSTLAPGNAGDAGRFVIHYDKMPAAVDKLMKMAGQLMAMGDKAEADEVIAAATSPEGQSKVHQKRVADRMMRFRKEAFGYTIVY
jgi:hypothetical protein